MPSLNNKATVRLNFSQSLEAVQSPLLGGCGLVWWSGEGGGRVEEGGVKRVPERRLGGVELFKVFISYSVLGE